MKTQPVRHTPKAANPIPKRTPSPSAGGRNARILRTAQDITGRVWTQEVLQKSEERYHLLFNSMTEGFALHELIFDENGEPCDYRFLDVNRAFEQLTGLKREDLIGKGQREVLPEEDPFWFKTYCKVALSGESIHLEHYSSTLQRHYEVYAYCPAPNQFAVVFMDITRRKQVENALVASEAELRALFASMQDVVMVIDRDGVYRKIAPTNPGLLDIQPKELLGKNLKDVFPVEKAEAFREVVQRVLDTKQNTQIEYEFIIGIRSAWFQTTISPLNADSTLWVAHDITKRKQMEEALRTAEANYHSIFENATVGIYQSSLQGCFLSINPAMAHIFGYDSPEEMLTSIASIEKQYYADPATRHEIQRLLMDHGEVRGFISRNRRKDGGDIWVQESARAVKDANGSILYYEGFISDITLHKQAEDGLHRAKNALEITNHKLQQSLAREQLLARTDGLTGLYNYRHFIELASHEFRSAMRYQRLLAILMFDMDNFKQVNDIHGHNAGDKLLMLVAQTAAAQVRASDVVARYGGDEFIVMLPYVSGQQARSIAERICASVAAIRVDEFNDDKEPFAVTLSIGIAELWREPMDENVERIIQRADEAMYKAKQSGRNRIVLFGQDETGAI